VIPIKHYLIAVAVALLIFIFILKRFKRIQRIEKDIPKAEASGNIAYVLKGGHETLLINSSHLDKFSLGEIIAEKYIILEKLGKGGMGQVYLCRSTALGTLWAIKYIPQSNILEKAHLIEEGILKKLNHIYLPKIIDVIHEDKGVYIVESYIEGTPLNEMMDNEGPFDEEIVIGWGIQLLDALDYLHSIKPNPIIYCDMKPSNVIITKNNIATLIDFGVSREYSPAEGDCPNKYIGYTAAYAAPEQVLGFSDQRTDLYNLGLMLLYLLTKEEADMLKRRNFKINTISETLLQVLYKAIHVKPEERYQRARDFKEAISNLNRDLNKKIKFIRELPADYKKIIGIYSPYSTGKTTLACNLASCYIKKGLKVALIDTDCNKKDAQYHFDIDFSEHHQLLRKLYKDIQQKKQILCIEDYCIKIKDLEIYTEHRDSIYNFDYEMLEAIIRNTNSNIIIVDISSNLQGDTIKKIWSACNDQLLVVDRTISNILGLPSRMKFMDPSNYKNLSLVINKDIAVRGLTDKELLDFLCDIEVFGVDSLCLQFKNVFKIPNKYRELIEQMLIKSPTPLYGKDKDFDKSIDNIAEGLYQLSSKDKGNVLYALKKVLNT